MLYFLHLFFYDKGVAVAVIYSLLVSVFIYKGLDWKGVWRVLENCVDTLSAVLILISTSSIFGYCLTTLHISVLASRAIIGLTDNPILIALLLLNLILLVLGCIMDMAPIILIAPPVLLPVAESIYVRYTAENCNRGVGEILSFSIFRNRQAAVV